MPELKNVHKIFFIFAFAAFICCGNAYVAAGREGGSDLSVSLRRDVAFLADSTMKGRGTGTVEVQRAIFHIARRFIDAGLWTKVQSFSANGAVGHNVIGMTPGFYDRYVLVCAYFDGLGVMGENMYPGADSNASGVAALMHLASMLSAIPDGNTGFIFAAFDGHGADMAGSRAFADDFGKRLNIVLVANLDIVGASLEPVRKNRPDYLMALGGEMFDFSISKANRDENLHISYSYYGSRNFTDLFYKSMGDQKWFVQKKIPAVMFTSGITQNTNKPADTADSLDYEVFAKRVRVIGRWLKSQL